jgi:hypothetical protein
VKRIRLIALLVSVAVVTSSLACTVCRWQGIYDPGRVQGVRGSGRVVEERFEVDDFTGVELATFGNLYIEVGEEEGLRVEAEDNLVQYFEVAVHGGMLEIKGQPGVLLRPTKPVNFYLTAQALDTVMLSGSGDIEAPDLEARRISVTISGSGDIATGDLVADAVEVQISGSGDLDVSSTETGAQEIAIYGSGDVRIGNLEADTVEVRILGSGNLDILEGQADQQRVTLSGSGDYDARHLKSTEASVRIDGSGSMTVQVRERLEARISGSGDVRYVGSPTVEQSGTGSGDVQKIGDYSQMQAQGRRYDASSTSTRF